MAVLEESPRRPAGLAARPDVATRTVAADALVYSLGVYGGQALLAAAGLVQKGLLGPTNAGYWALMMTFWTLLTIAPLGAFHGAARQIPAHRGRGDYESAASVADTGSSFSLAAIVVAGLLVSAFALAFGSGWAPELRYGLMLICLTGPLVLFANSHEVIFQGTKRFGAASATEVARAMTYLLVQTGFVLVFGYWGMFFGLATAPIVLYLMWRRMGLVSFRQAGFSWRVDRGRLRELIGFGAPIMIHGQIWLLFIAIDNLIVARFIDVEHLGYYALAVTVTSYILLLPRAISAAIFPRMTEQFAAERQIDSISHYTTDVQQLLAYMLLPVFMGGAFFLLPALIRQGLPEFEAAIPVVHVMVAASFFLALINMPIKLLIAAGYRWSLTVLMALCLAFNGAVNYLAVAVLDKGLKGAAVATAISYFVAFLAATVYAMSKAFNTRTIVLQLSSLAAVFVYVTAALWGIEEVVGPAGGGLVEDAAVSLAKLAILLVLVTPWLVLAQVRYGGPGTVWSLMKSGARKLRGRLTARS